jgi:formate C-acetyltransferase
MKVDGENRWDMSLLNLSIRFHPDHDYPHLRPFHEKYGIISGIGIDQHFGPDYKIGFELGWGGILEKIRTYWKLHGSAQDEFYSAHEKTVLAIQRWIARTSSEIRRRLEAETDAELAANLAGMLESNDQIVAEPPRTLRDACQWMAWWNIITRSYNREGAGPQLDELLRPYYERDASAGLIDDETAIFYFACLFLNDTHYYEICVPDLEGNDTTSRVSYLLLEAAHRMKAGVNLTIRVHDKLDPEILRLSVRNLLEDKKGCPRYTGEPGLMEGYMRNGYSRQLARDRLMVGCNWMTIPGKEYTMNDVVKLNLAKVFEVAYQEMMGDASAAPSVERLWSLFSAHLRKAIGIIKEGHDWHLAYMKDSAPELVLNLLCHGPIERAHDASDGGVDLYNMCIDGMALANVADSFSALEQRIEIEGLIDWDTLTAILESDWEGIEGERVRAMMLSSEKYGQGVSRGDAWALRITDLFTRLCADTPTPKGRRVVPGWFAWANALRDGKYLKASPDGRRKGDPIAHGANPSNGFRSDGAATAIVASVAAVQPRYGNTAPVQLDFDPGTLSAAEQENVLLSLIVSHARLGGTLLNLNILDVEKLKEAKDDPDKYPNLIVRLTGFPVFFASLSPEYRQLVIDRVVGD